MTTDDRQAAASHRRIRRWLALGLLAIFVAWVTWYVTQNLSDFTPILEVRPGDLFALLLAFAAIMALNGYFVAILTTAFGLRLKSAEWLSLSMASSFANYFLPFRGGAGLRAIYLARVRTLPLEGFLSSLAALYVMHVVVNAGMAIAGMAMIAAFGGPRDPLLAAFFLLLAVAGSATFFVDFRRGEPGHGALHERFARLTGAIETIRRQRSLVAKLWTLVIVMTAVSVWQCSLAFQSVAVPLSGSGVLVYAAAKNLSGLISLTPGALGIVELTSIYLGTILEYDTSDALLVQALIRAVALVALVLCGPPALWYLKRTADRLAGSAQREAG